MFAAEWGHLEVVEMLLKAGAEVNLKNRGEEVVGGKALPLDYYGYKAGHLYSPGGKTALAFAVENGHMEVAGLLRGIGAVE